MSSNEYHFITTWRVKSTVEDVSDIIGNAPDLVRWWPSVYLDVQELEPGDERGVGRVVDLFTKGWLPYTLRWQFQVTQNHYPYGFSLKAWGDFNGRGIWTFEQDGGWVNISYDWKIRADKPLLRFLSPLLKPIFSANHRWAMAKGEESLKLELARRQAATPQQRAHIPAPPPPTGIATYLPWLSVPLVIGLLMYLYRRTWNNNCRGLIETKSRCLSGSDSSL